MFWSCFAGVNLGPLFIFGKGGISSMDYIQVLTDGLLPFLETLNGVNNTCDSDTIQVATVGNYIFQQDNAPIHTSAVTRAFFHQYHITVMDWPAMSPDLNPIENLWPIMKDKFYKKWKELGSNKPSQSAQAVEVYKEILQEVWKEGLNGVLKNLVRGMPKRIAEVIANKDGHCHW